MLLVVMFYLLNGIYDELFLFNYVFIYMKDVLVCVQGVGWVDVMIDFVYVMWIWLDLDWFVSLGMMFIDFINVVCD